MFCPRCGFRQVSGEVQYCSSCGFALKGVQQMLHTGGMNPLVGIESGTPPESPRRRGLKQGVMLWLIGAVLVPLFAVLDASEEFVATIAIICFIGGLARMLYARMFLDGAPPQRADATPSYIAPVVTSAALRGQPHEPALHASSAARLDASARRTTGQLVAPPSVTDHTTRLLERQSNEE